MHIIIVKCTLTTGEDVSEDVSEDNEKVEETTVRRKRWYRRIKPKAYSNYHDRPKTSKGTACVRF